jgi:WD40 repeat protein
VFITKAKLVAVFPLALTLVAGAATQPPLKSEPLRWSPGATLEREDPDGAGVSAVALSSDGKWALTGHDNGRVRLWNALTGTELELFNGQQGKVWAVRFLETGKALSVGEQAVCGTGSVPGGVGR